MKVVEKYYYENEMFLSAAMQEDGLTITSKGQQGLEQVFLNLLKVC